MSPTVSATGWVTLLLATAMIAAGGWVLCVTLRVARGHRSSAIFTLGLAFISVASIVAGTLHHYDRPTLIAVAIAFLASTVIVGRLARRRRGGSAADDEADTAGPGSNTGAAHSRPRRSIAVVLAVLVAANAAEYFWRGVLAVRLPAQGYDGLYYRLINIATWVNTHQLGRPLIDLAPGSHDPTFLTQADSFPKNVEVSGGWIAVLTHSMAAVGLVQLVFVLWFAVAVAGCARAVGIAPDLAQVAGALTTLCPAVVAQSDQIYADIARAAPIMATFQFLMLALPVGARSLAVIDRTALAISGLALGFGLGVTGSNLLFVPVVILVMTCLLAGVLRRSRDGGAGLGDGTLAAAMRRFSPLVLVPAVVVGGYWYIRAWINWGSPFWPYSVGPFSGRSRFNSGVLAEFHTHSATVAVIESWWDATSLYDGQVRGDAYTGTLGLVWLVFGLPAVACLLVKHRTNTRAAFSVVVPIAACTLFSPASYNTRLSSLLDACGAIALMALVHAYLSRSVGEPAEDERTAGRTRTMRHDLRRTRRTRVLVVAVVVAASVAGISDAWAATRFGNWGAVAGGTSIPTFLGEMHAVGASSTVRANSGATGYYDLQTMSKIPAGTRIGFFSDGVPNLTYDLLGPAHTNRLVVLGVPATAANLVAARRSGLRYVFVASTSALLTSLPDAGALAVGPVYSGTIVDLDPQISPALPTAAEVATVLGAPVTAAPTTVENVVRAATTGHGGAGGCSGSATLTAHNSWTAGPGRSTSAAVCVFSGDAIANQISLDVLAHVHVKQPKGRKLWQRVYESTSTLSYVYTRPHGTGADYVAVVRLADRIEILCGTAPAEGIEHVVDLAEALSIRLGALH